MSTDPERKICSYATIQSDKKGQFGEIVAHLESKTDEFRRILDRVESAYDSNIDRVCFAAELLAHVEPIPIWRKKDASEAKRLRSEGNELFQKKRVEDALRAYNASVLRAPSSGDGTLSLAMANRSACLFHLGDYKETVGEIHSAIASGYPEEQRHKLYIRMAKCYLKLGAPARARPSLLIAKNLLKNLPESSSVESEVDDLMKICDAKSAPASVEQVQRSESDMGEAPSLTGGKNPSMSAKLDVKYSSDAGRYVISREDIKVGDDLVCEDPYAAVLYPKKFGLNCQTCFRRLKVAVPCPDCSGVAFCSVACRDQSTGTFHKYECQVNEVMSGFGCSQVARLAYRMIACKPLQYFLNLKDQLMGGTDEANTSISNADAYVRVFNLAANNSQRWAEDNLRRSLMAALLLKMLRMTGYFPPDASSFEVAFIGSLLLRHLQVLQFNAHEVYETLRPKKDSLSPCKSNAIGLAVYPTASLFNHSCHGGVARYFLGTKMVLVAVRAAAAGEEVQENYGPTFYFKGRNERRRYLRARYWFDCKCTACADDWPLLKDLPAKKHDKLKPYMEKALDMMAKGKATEARMMWCKILAVLKAKRPPTEECIRAEDKLRTCVSNLGNLAIVPVKEKEKPRE